MIEGDTHVPSKRLAEVPVALCDGAIDHGSDGCGGQTGCRHNVDGGTEAQYRQALIDLNVDNSGPHTITLSADITLAGSADPTYTGPQPLTIDGDGYTLDGNGNSRVLYVNNGGGVKLVNITITGGFKSGGPGGGVYVLNADLMVVNSVVTGNVTFYGDGGGIGMTQGDLRIVNSVISNNVGEDGGGVIATTVTIVNSTVSGNIGRWDKGEGGGVFGERVTVVNSIISGNSSNREGGGIQSRGPLVLRNSEVTGNSAPSGANINVWDLGNGSGMTARNSTVTNPIGSANCDIDGGTVAKRSFDDDGSCGF